MWLFPGPKSSIRRDPSVHCKLNLCLEQPRRNSYCPEIHIYHTCVVHWIPRRWYSWIFFVIWHKFQINGWNIGIKGKWCMISSRTQKSYFRLCSLCFVIVLKKIKKCILNIQLLYFIFSKIWMIDFWKHVILVHLLWNSMYKQNIHRSAYLCFCVFE